jgi:pyruvate ferredoxin oxidoreductase gamma subunit
VRISAGPIRLRSGVKNPSVVVVLDSSLLAGENVAAGVPSGGLILVNGTDEPAALRARLNLPADIRLGVVDAMTIANETIGRPIPNTPMLGALAKMSDVVTLEAAEAAVKKTLGKKLAPAVIEGNVLALQRAYKEVKVA